jgi:PAS domain S-box-containing protein
VAGQTSRPPIGHNDNATWRIAAAVALPFCALGIQWLLWPWIQPFVWFLFFPTVFIAARIGGRRGGLLATAISAILVWYFFIPPQLTFSVRQPSNLWSVVVFLFTGYLFGDVQERLERARDQAQHVAHESESKFQAIVEQPLAGLYIVQDGVFAYANPRFAEMLGYDSIHEVVGVLHPDDVITKDQPPGATFDELSRDPAGGSDRATLNVRRKDGEVIVVQLHSSAFRYEGRPAVIGLALDVTEQAAAERLLLDREALLKRTSHMARVGGWEFDALTGEGQWTDEIARIHDLDPSVEPSVAMGVGYYSEQSRPLIEQAVADAVDLALPYDIELDIISATGVHKWVRTTGEPVVENGKVVRVRGMMQDVTERRGVEEEVRQLNVDLERRVELRTAEVTAANKELEAFSYAVSHDLRAPLRAMTGFAQALEEDYGDSLDAEAKGYIDHIAAGGRRMSALIDGLLLLSRSTRGDLLREPIDVSTLSDRIFAELTSQDPQRDVAVVVAPDLSIDGDPRMIDALMRNLLGNAWKYTRGAEHAKIVVSGHDDPEGNPSICVADNGAGFDPAYAAQLFKPFQRLHTQDEFPGIGIGLATVSRIVERHGGWIAADGAVGEGARFCFTLPKTRREMM